MHQPLQILAALVRKAILQTQVTSIKYFKRSIRIEFLFGLPAVSICWLWIVWYGKPDLRMQ